MTAWGLRKATIATAGFAAGVVGMAWQRRLLVWIAIALLAAAFAIRFVERHGEG
jgi:membrane protein implicated in regulation of membrane protease activity